MSRETIESGGSARGWESVIKDGSIDHLGREGNWEASSYELTIDTRETDGAWLSICGDVTDFELRVRMMAQEGENASIFFRQHAGGQRFYQFDLSCRWQAVTVSKCDWNADPQISTIISAVNHELVRGWDYDVELAMRGESITTYVNGKLINQVRDAGYEKGGICLTAWKSRTRFTQPELRVY